MAALPISYRDIITPYNIYGEEKVGVTSSANNRIYVARQGGYRYRMQLTLRPFTLLKGSDGVKFETIKIHLMEFPSFSVPMFNTVSNEITGTPEVLASATTGLNGVSDNQVKMDGATYTGDFQPGQYIQFSNKNKVYQVRSYDNIDNIITLVQPLRQNLESGGTVYLNYQALDYDNASFNGVMGEFVNEDFGESVSRIEDGVLARINTLALVENL